jgi:phosphoribosylanthranilate isomerase
VAVEIKFCGLTRPEDAHEAGALGARYVGVIFAGGPRRLDPERARMVLDAAGPSVQRVGVFGSADPCEVARVARLAKLDVAQLHGDPTPDAVRAVRDAADVLVWAVARVAGSTLRARLDELEQAADAIVLDAFVPGTLGGTGVAFDWSVVARLGHRPTVRLVVAGGLTPANVGEAIVTLRPDVVDVSSGVERERGVKDHQRMRAFADAVRHGNSESETTR